MKFPPARILYFLKMDPPLPTRRGRPNLRNVPFLQDKKNCNIVFPASLNVLSFLFSPHSVVLGACFCTIAVQGRLKQHWNYFCVQCCRIYERAVCPVGHLVRITMSLEHWWFDADRENRRHRRTPYPTITCRYQMSHRLAWNRTRACAMRSRRLITWTMARSQWTETDRNYNFIIGFRP